MEIDELIKYYFHFNQIRSESSETYAFRAKRKTFEPL